MEALSKGATNLTWLLSSFMQDVPGVVDAVVVSSDGLLLVMSDGIGQAGGDQMAAVASGLTSLTMSAARAFGHGAVRQVIVELEHGYLFFMSISDGSALAVIASKGCDVGHVVFEMVMMVKRVGSFLTPTLVEELKDALANQ